MTTPNPSDLERRLEYGATQTAENSAAVLLREAVAEIAALRAQVAMAVEVLEPFVKGWEGTGTGAWWTKYKPATLVRACPTWTDEDERILCTVGDLERASQASDLLSSLKDTT